MPNRLQPAFPEQDTEHFWEGAKQGELRYQLRRDDGTATAPQLHFLAARLTESLHDVHRIARSRGDRLAVEDEGEVHEDGPGD